MKKIATVFALLGISTSVLAAQCPGISNFSHQQGSQWVLSSQSQATGWAIASNSDTQSSLTAIPTQSSVSAELAPNITACVYELDNPNSFVVAYNNQVADFSKLGSNFMSTGWGGYYCTTVGENLGICGWEWKA